MPPDRATRAFWPSSSEPNPFDLPWVFLSFTSQTSCLLPFLILAVPAGEDFGEQEREGGCDEWNGWWTWPKHGLYLSSHPYCPSVLIWFLFNLNEFIIRQFKKNVYLTRMPAFLTQLFSLFRVPFGLCLQAYFCTVVIVHIALCILYFRFNHILQTFSILLQSSWWPCISMITFCPATCPNLLYPVLGPAFPCLSLPQSQQSLCSHGHLSAEKQPCPAPLPPADGAAPRPKTSFETPFLWR